MVEGMIKDRPRQLNLIYVNQPLYFVTFATRDRKRIPSLHCAQVALEQYGHCATSKFNVALGRYVIMPDHAHLFVRGDQHFMLSSWIGGLKRAISVALRSSRIWQPGFFDHILRGDESYAEKWSYVRDNPVRAGLVRTADEWPYQGEIRRNRSSVTVVAGVSSCRGRRVACALRYFAADTAASTVARRSGCS
jgi:REP element-mobilizing transposase RayT